MGHDSSDDAMRPLTAAAEADRTGDRLRGAVRAAEIGVLESADESLRWEIGSLIGEPRRWEGTIR